MSMFMEQTSAEPEDNQDDDVGDHDYYLRVLREMTEIGAKLARIVEKQADDHPERDPAEQFERITRSMRRNIMLAEKLGEAKKLSANRTAVRKRIIRDVEDAIHKKAPKDQQETLQAEFLERLDMPDMEDEISNRSITEIVIEICRDLGIYDLPGSHPWKRRMLHDIAVLNARAAHVARAKHPPIPNPTTSPPPPPPAPAESPTGTDPPTHIG